MQSSTPSFRQILPFWCLLGWISFGGPAAQIALLQQELVQRRRLISSQRFLHALNYCLILPGPEAQQLVIYTAWLLHGRWAGICAGLLFILPAFFIMMGGAWLFLQHGQHPMIQAALQGLWPTLAVMMLYAAYQLAKKTLTTPVLVMIATLGGLGTLLHWPFWLMLLAAIFVGYRHRVADDHPMQSTTPHSVYMHDDHSAIPPHAHASLRNTLLTLMIGVVLIALPLLVLVACLGISHPLVQLSWIFIQTALLSFGGAYVVLPSLYQALVLDHQWLSPKHMVSGLALGETTPGPLIMVVVFVAFLAAYQHQFLGAELAFEAGLLAALLSLWLSFVPSFVLILAGAPWIESTRKIPKLQGSLLAIRALVVGLLFGLASIFMQQLFHLDSSGHWSQPLLLSIAAAFWLFVAKRSMLSTLLLGACGGLVFSMF